MILYHIFGLLSSLFDRYINIFYKYMLYKYDNYIEYLNSIKAYYIGI